MLLEAAEASLGADHPSARHVARALRSARENLAESRRLVWALRPEPLDRSGLPEALERLARRLSEETGIEAETIVTGDPRSLAEEQEAGLLRVAQEALANVRKHARAASATVTLSYMPDITVLDVHDDGMGFDPDQAMTSRAREGGVGLAAIRERVHELGGTLQVESRPGEGSTVVVELPSHHSGSHVPVASHQRR
jgi:signal transduction histidine kinase